MKIETYTYTEEQEAAADRFVDQGLGSYDDFRRQEGMEPTGVYEPNQLSVGGLKQALLSERAMTAEGAEELLAVLREEGDVDPGDIR